MNKNTNKSDDKNVTYIKKYIENIFIKLDSIQENLKKRSQLLTKINNEPQLVF